MGTPLIGSVLLLGLLNRFNTCIQEDPALPADADAVTSDYGNARLNALKTSMLAVGLLAVLLFWFTRRLPGRTREAA